MHGSNAGPGSRRLCASKFLLGPEGGATYFGTKQLVFIFALVMAVPTTVLAADWLLERHIWPWRPVAPQWSVLELQQMYQLRELCNESNFMEGRLDFAIQKLWDKGNYFNAEAQANALLGQRNQQIQNLRERNSRYLAKIFGGVDQSAWADAQGKHDELARTVASGEFQACVTELDAILPTHVRRGGRQ